MASVAMLPPCNPLPLPPILLNIHRLQALLISIDVNPLHMTMMTVGPTRTPCPSSPAGSGAHASQACVRVRGRVRCATRRRVRADGYIQRRRCRIKHHHHSMPSLRASAHEIHAVGIIGTDTPCTSCDTKFERFRLGWGGKCHACFGGSVSREVVYGTYGM